MLTQPSQCYLVLLIATAGLTFGAQESVPQGSRGPVKQDPAQTPSHPPLGPSQEPATLVRLSTPGACVLVTLCVMHVVKAWLNLQTSRIHQIRSEASGTSFVCL